MPRANCCRTAELKQKKKKKKKMQRRWWWRRRSCWLLAVSRYAALTTWSQPIDFLGAGEMPLFISDISSSFYLLIAAAAAAAAAAVTLSFLLFSMQYFTGT